jgi:hypothetical protein
MTAEDDSLLTSQLLGYGNCSAVVSSATHFPSDSFNLAEYILRTGKADHVAIHFAREGVEGIERVIWQELRNRTREPCMAQWLIREGGLAM